MFPFTDFFHAVLLFSTFTFSPGPNNLLGILLGEQYGYRKSLPFLFGVWLGRLTTTTLLLVLGLHLLFHYNWEQPLLIFFGSLYMLHLAWKTIKKGFSKWQIKEVQFKNITLWQAIALQWVNPKAFVVQITLISIYKQPTLTDNLIFFFVLNSLILFSLSVWILAGKKATPYLKKYRLLNLAFHLILGGLLAYLSLTFIFNAITSLFHIFT